MQTKERPPYLSGLVKAFMALNDDAFARLYAKMDSPVWEIGISEPSVAEFSIQKAIADFEENRDEFKNS